MNNARLPCFYGTIAVTTNETAQKILKFPIFIQKKENFQVVQERSHPCTLVTFISPTIAGSVVEEVKMPPKRAAASVAAALSFNSNHEDVLAFLADVLSPTQYDEVSTNIGYTTTWSLS